MSHIKRYIKCHMVLVLRALPFTLLASVSLTSLAACNGNGGNNATSSQAVAMKNQTNTYQSSISNGVTTKTLTEAETQGILWMREEEKLAYDVYRTLYDAWGIQAFDNISQSEARHMDAMKMLIDRYGLTDPMDATPIGTFTNTDLQALYDALVAKGKQSKLDALYVGAEIEELDIADLRTHIAATQKQDIMQVYNNLLRGSRNHLRAFDSLIKNLGQSYTAQHISQADYDAIAAAAHERGANAKQGGHMGQGRGMGGGQGMRRGWR